MQPNSDPNIPSESHPLRESFDPSARFGANQPVESEAMTGAPDIGHKISDDEVDDYPPIGRPREATFGEAFSRFVWLFSVVALVAVVWKVGPLIVREYQYAITAGKMKAEYDTAVQQLADNPLSNVSQAFQLVAQKVRPSVVSVKTKRADSQGQGSGVVMSSDGYILTNAHVADGADQIQVWMYDRNRYSAKLIGKDPASDLAVIKIDAPDLIPASWANSDELEVGSIVWAFGSPYGLDQTVTSGIISGKHRRADDNATRELLQTDAAVNPGNSGGPLVNANGQVIGINTSIFGDSFQGISFAVPSETAMFVYGQLIKKGFVDRGYLGVEPEPVRQRVAQRMKRDTLDGAYLSKVMYNTPASSAGLQSGDIIVQWNGQPITVYSMLFRMVEMTPPGIPVPIKIVRNGIERSIEVTVGAANSFELPQRRRYRGRQNRMR